MTRDGERAGEESIGRSRAKIISASQERCFRAVTNYIEAANSLDDGQSERVAAAELHNAVIAYYLALDPLSEKDAVADYWDEAGLDNLSQMMVQYESVEERESGFLGERSTTRREPKRLSPRTLLVLARSLDRAAVRLGFAPEVDSGDGELYEVKRDPDEYGDPIDDDIPKPE